MEHHPKGAIEEIENHRGLFVLAFVGLFILTFGFLYVVGATPDTAGTWERNHGGELVTTSTAGASEMQNTQAIETPVQGELPMRIVADSIGLEVVINNPISTDLQVLDEALLTGAVRYPTSGELGINGTVLLFGHSSYLPAVYNRAYKAFNNIQNLRTGDEISVYSVTKEYRYRVTGVRKASAATDDSIPLPSDVSHLTLVTCDSFGQKADRFVVTAEFAGAYSLISN